MRHHPAPLRSLLFSLMALLFCAACTDDNISPGGDPLPGTTSTCAAGEIYNPVLGRCVVAAMAPPPTGEPDMDAPPDQNAPDMLDMSDIPVTPPPSDMDSAPDQDAPADMPDITPTPDMTTGCGYGSIIGRACAPSGDILAGATVTIQGEDCHTGMPFTTTVQSAGDGSYAFTQVPAGAHVIEFSQGSFSRTFSVGVVAGVEEDLTLQGSKFCIEADTVKIAVVGGLYDHVEGVLDALQLSYDMKGDDGGATNTAASLALARSFLKDPQAMAAYDIIFINCGELWGRLNGSDRTTIATNLFNHVRAGRSFYASDWAHMFVETAVPTMVDFLGNDATLSDARQGYAPQTIQASVTSPALQATLGHNTVAIEFPHNPSAQLFNNNWTIMEGALPTAVIHLRGSARRCGGTGCPPSSNYVQNAPLLVSYTDPGNGGSIVFTSFHNERQHEVNPDMMEILKFLIFQL